MTPKRVSTARRRRTSYSPTAGRCGSLAASRLAASTSGESRCAPWNAASRSDLRNRPISAAPRRSLAWFLSTAGARETPPRRGDRNATFPITRTKSTGRSHSSVATSTLRPRHRRQRSGPFRRCLVPRLTIAFPRPRPGEPCGPGRRSRGCCDVPDWRRRGVGLVCRVGSRGPRPARIYSRRAPSRW